MRSSSKRTNSAQIIPRSFSVTISGLISTDLIQGWCRQRQKESNREQRRQNGRRGDNMIIRTCFSYSPLRSPSSFGLTASSTTQRYKFNLDHSSVPELWSIPDEREGSSSVPRPKNSMGDMVAMAAMAAVLTGRDEMAEVKMGLR